MKFALLLLALTAFVNSTYAQTSATVYVLSSTQYGSYNYQMSTSFVFLKLPSGGGSVSITITPGDYAANEYITSYADHTQAGPYYAGGPSTSFTIGTAGHYWMYLSANAGGTPTNFDYLEIRVVASTYTGSTSCYYCAPPSNWGTGWPPLGTPQETGLVPVSNQPASQNPNILVPRWVVPVLAVVIAVATLLPISYCLYRRHQNKKAMAASSSSDQGSTVEGSSVELQTSAV